MGVSASVSVLPSYSFFFFFFKFYFIFKLYITVLDLPNIKMNPSYSYFVHMEARAKRFSDLPIFHD